MSIAVQNVRKRWTCGGDLVAHRTLPGLVCQRCGYYFDNYYLEALGLKQPLTCGMPISTGGPRA